MHIVGIIILTAIIIFMGIRYFQQNNQNSVVTQGYKRIAPSQCGANGVCEG